MNRMIPGEAPSRGRRPREVTGRTVLACLVVFFGVIAAVNAIMITAAVTTFGGVETASSYQAGRLFGREMAAGQAQAARQWQVTAALRPQAGGLVTLELAALDAAKRPLEGMEATVRLAHPATRRLDVDAAVEATGNGRFTGTAEAAPGQWDLVIELARGGERLFRSRERITLKPAAGP